MWWAHKRFFEVWSPALPIIYEARFNTEISVHQPSNSALCLSYAVALLGATHLPSHSHLEDNLLATSRTFLDLCETAQDDGDIASLNLVQALILMFRHALATRGSFSQARIALGRAIQFGKMFSLHQMDIAMTNLHLWHLRTELPPSNDLAVLEERRRTYWALYIFDSYASTRTGIPCQLVDDYENVCNYLWKKSQANSFSLTSSLFSYRAQDD